MSGSAGQRLERCWPECQLSKRGKRRDIQTVTFPRAPSKEKGAFSSAFTQLHVFHVHVFCTIFFGDDVTRFPCGYIYIYHLV